jgi:hypothetical protein
MLSRSHFITSPIAMLKFTAIEIEADLTDHALAANPDETIGETFALENLSPIVSG